MAGRRSAVTDIREIVRRVQSGEPDRRIAWDLGISRNTVAHYRLWAEHNGLVTGPLPEPAVLAALVQPAPQDRPAHEQSFVEAFREQALELMPALLVEQHSFGGSYSW
jgi:hypothetical protein